MTKPSAKPWDERYGSDEFFYGTEPNDFLREQAGEIPAGGEVLCLAEGEGRNAVFLARRGHRITAVDQSAVGLDKAKKLAAAHGVTIDIVVADLGEYVIAPNRWSGIVSIWCHLPGALRRRVHAQIVEGLAPGGVLIFEAYTPDQIPRGTGGPKDADLLSRVDELNRAFAGLQIVRAEEIEREVREGRGHGGMSSVVRVVARKKI